MPRLYKFAITGFLAYAIATASPDHQAEIGRGVLAIKDAAVEACTRDNSPCTVAMNYAASALGSFMSDQPAPWMDDNAKRPQPSAPLVRPQSPGTS